MKKTIVLFLAAVLVLGFASYTLIGADTVSNERLIGDLEYAPNQVIVGLKDEASALKSQLKSLTANPALSPSGLFNEVNVVAVKDLTAFPQAQWLSTSAQAGTGEVMVLTLMLDNNQSLSDTIVLLEQNPNVEYAHPNYQFSHTVIPNDPLTEYLPPMLRIEADKAWDIETGSKDVTVGIIDTGLDFLHEDLQDNADMILAYNVVEDNQNVMDYVGHGSHIGGIIGAKGDNEIGIAGVCWDISLVPVKVNFDDIEGDAWTSDIIAGIYYAEEVQLDVINVSYDIWAWGAFQELEDAVNNFSGLVVGAAGNYGDDLDDWYPYFTCDNLILVGSSSLKDKRNEWSCFGAETVHLFAPGDEIYSTLPDNQYGFMSGTSMAAPMVAGVAALLKSREPMLTTQEIKDRILDNVDVKPKLADICISGGRLNAFKVLEPPIELPIYIMEVEVYAESLVGFDVIIDNYSRNGFIDAVLENAGDIITLIPHIFELVNGNYVIADNEIASITFYLDDIQYHPPGLALGEFELEALWSATLLTIEVELLNTEIIKYDFEYSFRIIQPDKLMDIEVYADWLVGSYVTIDDTTQTGNIFVSLGCTQNVIFIPHVFKDGIERNDIDYVEFYLDEGIELYQLQDGSPGEFDLWDLWQAETLTMMVYFTDSSSLSYTFTYDIFVVQPKKAV